MRELVGQASNASNHWATTIFPSIVQIVLTTYNSATYKIDDIAWERSPADTVTLRDKTECTFLKYYEDVRWFDSDLSFHLLTLLQKYQLKISDPAQPLLLSRPSKKNRRAGMTTPFMLIPELCCITGQFVLLCLSCTPSDWFDALRRHQRCDAIRCSIHERNF